MTAATGTAPGGAEGAPGAGIPRLDFRIERLRATYRFTFAFHAREVRFEADSGDGFSAVFPETFSFHAERHDPSELYLRLDDLWTNPRRLHPKAGRRDAEEMIFRLLGALPEMLTAMLDRLDGSGALGRTSEDVAVFCLIAQRFISDKALIDHPRLRIAGFHFRSLLRRALDTVVSDRVTEAFMEAYVAGEERAEASSDPHDFSFFYAIAEGDQDEIDRRVLGAAERAYHRWLEDVCLDSENRAFETEDSPFGERAHEVLQAVAPGAERANRGRDLSPFLCRGGRDNQRILVKLDRWFLHQYDVHHAAVIRQHLEGLRAGDIDLERRLTLHGVRNYAMALSVPALPFIAAIFFYEEHSELLDWWASLEVLAVLAAAFWFLAYRFLWKKDLTFFHTSVPRIGAGIIVGYLPVFMIDEVWDLAEQAPFYLLAVSAMLGTTTFLYIYVEVRGKLGDAQLAFARARDLVLLGLIQAAGFGLLVTSLLGPLMGGRNWGPNAGMASLESLRMMDPWVGELPRIMGIEPFVAFPTTVLLMSFMSFFIGTFLQLLWEELPITEPL
jgi:hypothetical protein